MAKPARVISVFSTKGGVGKTLIATNLAATLCVQHDQRTALLEVGTGRDAAAMVGAIGVHYVPEQFTKESLPTVLASLQRAYDYIVIDAGSILNEVAVAALERSNLILLVATPDLVSLQHLNRTIELLQAMKFPLRMMAVVINRAESHGNFRSRELKGQFPVGVLAEIPSDGRLAGLSVNQRVPLVMMDSASRIKDTLKQLGTALIDHPAYFVEQVSIDRTTLPPAPPEALTAVGRSTNGQAASAAPADPIVALKGRVHARLIEKFDLKRLNLKLLNENDPVAAKQLKDKTAKAVLELMAEEGSFVTGTEQRMQLVKEIVDEALGLGPLEDLMSDDEVSDVLVNGKDRIYVEKRGKLYLTEKKFVSNDQVLTIIERIIAPLGRRIDESNPMVDARLPDGSRVNAIIQPLSLKGPMLAIRKFARKRYTIEDLLRMGTLSRPMADFLNACVLSRKNLLVSGGTGSGKTTLLNVLSSFIPERERIITIEDAAELQLAQVHWIALEARMPNVEGKGQVSIRQLFRNTLRMRPDRVIIGECRGDETFDMLQAMNTGHDGSLTTLHANSPHDVIARLDSLVLMSNVELPVRAIREQIASALHLVVHTARLLDGSRKITHITEVTGLTEQANVTFQDVFVFRQRGLGATGEVIGEFEATGYVPSFVEELKAKGVPIDERLFLRPA